MKIKCTYIGGPTALLEVAGLRFLTDPTFDPADSAYPSPTSTLHKTAGPAIDSASIGHIDAVLLSHDHHADNLDNAGRELLKTADKVLTTQKGAERLGGNAIGLAPWQTFDLPTPDGHTLQVIATPARHGPEDGDRGPVIGFVMALTDALDRHIYVSGDTVWYEGVAEVSEQFPVKLALLFMGAARVKEVGTAHLTLTAEEAVEAARAFPASTVIPLHYEGWAHFSESRQIIDETFSAAGLAQRLLWLTPDQATTITI